MLVLNLRKGDSTIRFGPATWSEADGAEITASQAAARLNGKHVLVLVHGYRVTDALDAYARIAGHIGCCYDEIMGVTWPGSHVLLGYIFAQLRAVKAGELLADALKPICATLDIEGHSLGCRVTMEALRAGLLARNVLLTAPAIDNEALQVGERFGSACGNTSTVLVAFSGRDSVLRTAYTIGSWDRALGLDGPQDPAKCPRNVMTLDCTDEVAGHSDYKRCPKLYATWRSLAR